MEIEREEKFPSFNFFPLGIELLINNSRVSVIQSRRDNWNSFELISFLWKNVYRLLFLVIFFSFFFFIGTANRYFSKLYPIIFTNRDILSFVENKYLSKFHKMKKKIVQQIFDGCKGKASIFESELDHEENFPLFLD